MSATFVVSLTLVVLALLAARLLHPALPLRGRATNLRFAEVALIVVGLTTLTFHCGAMFFTTLVARLPGTDAAIDAIRALGTASLLWYVVPACVVLSGLRRVHWGAFTVIGLALLAIGVTMYNGGPVEQHLLAIWFGVVLLAAVVATLVRPPSSSVIAA